MIGRLKPAEQLVVALLETTPEDSEFVKSEIERLEVGHRIKISFSTYTLNDERGDYDEENGWIDELGVDMEPDEFDVEEGIDAVAKAAKYLRAEGATQASSYPFCPGTWYSFTSDDYINGSTTEQAYHLKGFTEEEEARVYAHVIKR